MKCFLYDHGGSGNHGCEALARTTVKMLEGDVYKLYSLAPEEDKLYGVNELVDVEYSRIKNTNKKKIDLIKASLQIKLFHKNSYSEYLDIMHMASEKGSVALSIGGDNYCYNGFERFCFRNKTFNDNGIKTVLWGCSIEPDMINDEMKKDLARYSLITARESITYEAIKKYNKNTFLFSDPAFTLETSEVNLPKELEGKKIIGLNVSPHIFTCRNDDLILNNLNKLILYILDNTNYSIMLVPHVVWKNNDDRQAMETFAAKYKDTGRVVMIDDCSCTKLKGYISKCEMFIGARTHATIAAYSSYVPTLVLGYSVKAKGIAKDIFGTYENYVLPVQELENEDDLTREFLFLSENKDSIKKRLEQFMPDYINNAYGAVKKLKEVFGN